MTRAPINMTPSTASARAPLTEHDAEIWQKEFPVLERRIHVANCSHSPQSIRVRTAIDEYLDHWLEVGMDWDRWMEEISRAKIEFAKLINASPDEIAISTSASEAIASLASAFDVRGDRRRILTTHAEFPTVGHVWLAHQKYGWEVDFIPVRAGRIEHEDYEKLVDERTLVTSATHVYYQNGFKQDIKRIADIVHGTGSLLLVDAYQSLGTCRVDVQELDVDFLVGGNLKYLLGIPGVAFIYAKRALVDSLKPAVTGWFGQEEPFAFTPHILEYAKGARRLDTGTPPIIAAVAARAGMEIINELQPSRIEARIVELSQFAIEVARDMGLEYVGPSHISEKGATTAIRVPDPPSVETLLRERNIVASARGEVIRIAPHFFTTKNDLEQVLGQVKQTAETVADA
jgi:selenocysteine lyase/cysteine desulfurase